MTVQSSNKFRCFSFVFTFVVIGYHSKLPILAEYDIIREISPFVLQVYNYLCSIAMSYFFMTSGYMLYNGATITNADSRFRRRIGSLLIPYLVWNLIYMGLFLVFRRDYFMSGAVSFIMGFTIEPFNGPFWYVLTIFCLSAFVGIVMHLRKMHVKILYGIWVLLFIISFMVEGFGLLQTLRFGENELVINWIIRFFRYLPAYILGCWLGLEHSSCVDLEFPKVTRIWLLIIVVMLTALMLSPFKVANIWIQINLTLQPIVLWIIAGHRVFNSKWSSIIQGGFLMYAMHSAVIMVARYILEKIIPTNMNQYLVVGTWLLFPFIMMLLVFLIARMLTMIMEKLHLRYIRLTLTGDRK